MKRSRAGFFSKHVGVVQDPQHLVPDDYPAADVEIRLSCADFSAEIISFQGNVYHPELHQCLPSDVGRFQAFLDRFSWPPASTIRVLLRSTPRKSVPKS